MIIPFPPDMKLSTSFIVNTLPGAPGDAWTAKIRADSRSSENATLSLLFYVFNEGPEELVYDLGNNGQTIESVTGTIDTVRENLILRNESWCPFRLVTSGLISHQLLLDNRITVT